MNYNQDIGRFREILPRVFIMKFTMPCGSPQDFLARMWYVYTVHTY